MTSPPELVALLDKADTETLKIWELLDMEKLPTWVNDKLAVLGDAAHPFLPHQGQGAGAAIEDAAALAVVLPPNTPPEDIPERLRLYEKFRYERAHNIQNFSRLAGRDIGEEACDSKFHFSSVDKHNCDTLISRYRDYSR